MNISSLAEDAPPDAGDAGFFHYQEISFCIVMGIIAVLSRENPVIVYPQVLWAFVGLFGFNLVYHYFLKRYQSHWFIPLVSLGANVCLISAVLHFTGGSESCFWPMYLLPIFSACLYLKPRHVWLALAASAAFLLYFYMDSLWDLAPWDCLEAVIKISVLALAALVTMRVSFEERRHRLSLRKKREQIDRMAQALDRKDAFDFEAEKMKTLGQLAAGILHNLNTPLTVILGSASLMLEETPEGSVQREDLGRILAAANACGRLTQNLLYCLRANPLVLEEADIGKIIGQAVSHFDYQIKSRHLAVTQDVPATLPKLRVSPVCLQLTLFDLLHRASGAAATGGRLELNVVAEPDGVGIRIACETQEGVEPVGNLETCRELLSYSGGWLDSRALTGTIEYRIHLRQDGK